PHLLHHTGDVRAEDMGEADGEAGQALADPEVEVVEGGGADADQHLSRAGPGIRELRLLEDLGAAVPADDHCTHARSPGGGADWAGRAKHAPVTGARDLAEGRRGADRSLLLREEDLRR